MTLSYQPAVSALNSTRQASTSQPSTSRKTHNSTTTMGPRILGIMLLVAPIFGAEFSYDDGAHGPANWASLYPNDCAGAQQSPIDLQISQATNINLGYLQLDSLFSTSTRPAGTVTNNGHSVELTFNGDFFISGGGLPGSEYKVEQLHYHFGSTGGQGSEHALDGKHHEAELHLVTYDTQYSSLDVAKYNTDGVAVFAGMIEVETSDNALYTDLLSYVEMVTYKGDYTDFSLSCCLVDLLPEDFGNFYRYSGSFTTPDCNENVIWTVWRNPVKISQAQIEVFRGLYSSEETAATKVPLADNYRPLQAINDRPISYSSLHNYRWVLEHN